MRKATAYLFGDIVMKQIVVIMVMIAILSCSAYALGFAGNLSMLSVKDGFLFDGRNEIVLKGVNLGGWMIMETWMSPVSDENETMAYSDVIRILNRRFGVQKATELIKEYENNFITEKDFERIKNLGFNCVRLPVWYRNFMTEDNRWQLNARGFERIDWVIEQCRKNDLYVIIDMHGCPGGQSTNHSTGVIGQNRLYDSSFNIDAMEKLWVEIAKRYKNNPTIAAYDIMNEPFNNTEEPLAESDIAIKETNAVYKKMISAIRRIDKKHIITIEGIWTMDILPDPEEQGWENMMYQLHIYDESQDMIDKRIEEFLETRDKYKVAVYAGEYNSKQNDAYAVKKYGENNISHTKWTYKTVGVNYDGWGIYNKNFEKVDIKTDSFDKIKEAFSLEMLTENGFE